MENVFWVIAGKLAGRPGPDRIPWNLAALRDAGIGAILSVNDGRLCHPEDFEACGIVYACIPLSENAPPQPGDDEICLRALPLAYAFLQQQMRDGRATVVHCSSGKDRTGLLLAYFLVRETGLSVAAAMEELRRVRPCALTAVGWYPFSLDILRRST